MTGNRMRADFCKGRGWTYTIGGERSLGPKTAADLLHHVYGLSYSTARERLTFARNGAAVALPEPRRPAREEVNA